MSDIKTLKVTDASAFARYTQLKIRLAGKINRIPTTNELVGALSDIGERHFDELASALTERETQQ